MSSPVTGVKRALIVHPKSGAESTNAYTPPIVKMHNPPESIIEQRRTLLLAYCVLSMSQHKFKGYCDSLDLSHSEITEWAKEVIRNVKTAHTHEMRDMPSQATHGSGRHDTESIRGILGRLPG